MTILITGGAGFIGSHMVWECLDRGQDVVVIDNMSTGFDWTIPRSANLCIGDIGDQAFVERILQEFRVETIIHFAGSANITESFASPLKYYENNAEKTRSLLEAATQCGVEKFIFSSTAAVYAAPQDGLPVAETATLEPASPYGHSKLAAEHMIQDVSANSGLDYVILRYFNVAGADPSGRTGLSTPGVGHVLKMICETALGKRSHFQIFGNDYDTPDGTPVRDFIHVSDLVGVHFKAMEYLNKGGRSLICNAGYNEGISVLQLTEAVRELTGKDFRIEFSPRRSGDVATMVADITTLKNTFVWAPRYNSVKTIAVHALEWERKLDSVGRPVK